jgi:hypothetical protein
LFYICKNIRIFSNKTLHIDQLKDSFKDAGSLNTSDIVRFYRSFDPQLKSTTINWRIYSLVQMGVLTRIGRGKFTFGSGKFFVPGLSNKLKTISSKLKKQYPFLETCIWNTSVFNEFMVHQPGQFYILVEVEKDAVQSVFFFLKESKYFVFIEPTRNLLDKYLPDEKDTLIVKPLVTEAPLQKIEGVSTVTLEKMLVDVFCDDVIFTAQQGSEMRNIFYEARSKYVVNENRMLRYANRRKRKVVFKEYYDSVHKEL